MSEYYGDGDQVPDGTTKGIFFRDGVVNSHGTKLKYEEAGNIFSIETYYKPYLNIYDLNPKIEPNNDETIALSGTGEAYGLELLYRLNKVKFL